MNSSIWQIILWSSVTNVSFIIIFLTFQFIVGKVRLKDRKEYFVKLHKELKKGDLVEFGNGFYGKVKSINNDDTVDIEVKSGIITISRYIISEIRS